MLSAKPLFSLERGGHEEVCVFGEVVMLTAHGLAFGSSDSYSRFPARSLLKPLQLRATLLASADRELPPCRVPAMGSISATAAQVAELETWHGESSLRERLDLPEALPMDAEHRAWLLARGGGPRTVFHPCYSKHLAILAACREHGWPLDGYVATGHPFHRELLRVLEPYLARGVESVQFVTDGCRLPTPVLSSRELACIYHRLAVAEEASVEGRLRRAMWQHPEWIGAADRYDTRLMRANPGRLIAKEGADGLLAIGIGPTASEPGGVGLLIKLAAGHQPSWAALAATPFLEALGLDPLREATPGQEVVWHAHPARAARTAVDVSPVLSEEIAVWPGDTEFRRKLMTEPGGQGSAGGPSWDLLVSSISTTLHVGAHADAPNHFVRGAGGIDQAPLGPYRGVCQVVHLDKPRGSLIGPEDLAAVNLTAPRLLFKTGSYPDPQRFNSDFVAFSPELIEWLEARDVVLIGIDTPSIDPFSSKTLPTHHATRRGRGIAILEGLDLSRVPPGQYELVALPLRLANADASPVRATLWPLR